MVNKRTSHMCVAYRHRSNSQQQLQEVTNARRPTCLLFETMQNGATRGVQKVLQLDTLSNKLIIFYC